jgi:hypothetical protein
MNERTLVALCANAFLLLALPAGCGSYDNKPPAASGAGGTGGATGGTGGATGGTGGATGGTGGSAAGSGGTGGSAAGSGGSSGTAAGTGGTSGGAGTGPAAGTGGDSGAGPAAGTGGGGGSGGADPASCENVTACGGDTLGTWTVASSCLRPSGIVDLSGFGIGCPSAPITGGMLTVTGSLSFMDGGVAMDNTITTGTEIFEPEAACLNISGTTTLCDGLNGSLAALGYNCPPEDPNCLAVDCVAAPTGGGCVCTAKVYQSGGMAFVSFDYWNSGTYTSASNELTLTGNTKDTKYPYCVAGTKLTMSLGTMGRTGAVLGTVVFQK